MNNIIESVEYSMRYWQEFDFLTLTHIREIRRPGNQKHAETFSDCYIMADTETSVTDMKYNNSHQNIVVAWTISIRAFHHNIVTLYGTRPSELVTCLGRIQEHLHGKITYVFFHNLAYDWVFCRRFMIREWGEPVNQLNTKPHNPIIIEFKNGIVLRDSYILAQRSLEKWAKDLDAEHQKAVGKWDYNKRRNQGEEFSADELEYIEHDTLAGVECLDITADLLHKNITTLPYTATGIPREQTRKRGKKFNAHEKFVKMAPSAEEQRIHELVYHGGFTHANRFEIGEVNGSEDEPVKCFDFSSSYPYCLLAFQYPGEKFVQTGDMSAAEILKYQDEYAFFFKAIFLGVELKDPSIPMPTLQYSKCIASLNTVIDNGRILKADFVVIYLNEIDFSIINETYDYKKICIEDCHAATKKYLPRWFTDYVYECYENKSRGKGGDPVLYNLRKATINSLYGMCCQRPVRIDMIEDYETGEFHSDEGDFDAKYKKYVDNPNTVLPYFIGAWCTSYAWRNLMTLGKEAMTGPESIWLYSDTDSIYGMGWDEDAVSRYNDEVKIRLRMNGYEPVVIDGKEYCPGVAEFDGAYKEFVTLGAKRYCKRDMEGKLSITIAGVPKRGVSELQDDISNFRSGFIFRGTETGKLMHTYIFNEGIFTDDQGNEVGDCIDLTPCDYLLDETKPFTIKGLFEEELLMQVYEDE